MGDDEKKPKLAVTGSWFVFGPLLREVPPVFWVGSTVLVLMFVFMVIGQDLRPDHRFYGTWDVYAGSADAATHCDTWTLSRPDLFGPVVKYETGSTGRWTVNDGLFGHGIKGIANRYEIVAVTPDRIDLIDMRTRKNFELRRKK